VRGNRRKPHTRPAIYKCTCIPRPTPFSSYTQTIYLSSHAHEYHIHKQHTKFEVAESLIISPPTGLVRSESRTPTPLSKRGGVSNIPDPQDPSYILLQTSLQQPMHPNRNRRGLFGGRGPSWGRGCGWLAITNTHPPTDPLKSRFPSVRSQKKQQQSGGY